MEREKLGNTQQTFMTEPARQTATDCPGGGLDNAEGRNTVDFLPSRAGSLKTKLFGRTTDNASSYATLDTTSEKQLAEYVYGTGVALLMNQGRSLAYGRAHLTKIVRRRGLKSVAFAINEVLSSGEGNASHRIVEIAKAHALQALQGVKDSEETK